MGTAQGGSGFVLRSQSATTLGSAQAGMTAGAEDVTSMIFNPAALARGSGFEGAVVGTGIFTSATFSQSSAATIFGTPITGSNGGNDGTQVLIPSLYFSVDLPAGFRAGLAVTSLYGLGSYWADGWVGRYHALNSQLVTQDFVLALSYEIMPSLSLGVGIDVEYAQIKSTSAIDFGTIDTALSGGLLGGIPGRSDGLARSKADSVAVGFLLGVLYEPVPGTQVGIGFRSGMSQNSSGTTTFEPGGATGAAYAASGVFIPTGVTTKLNLPAAASIGVSQRLDDNWTVMADLQWMGWNTFRSLQATFANPLQPPSLTVYDWHDSVFVAVGTKYRFRDDMTIRFGVAYDQSPARSSTRTPAIPDSDSVWTSIGFQYKPSETLKFDLAIGHIFVTSAPIALAATSQGNVFRGSLSGTVGGGSVSYIAGQVSFRY
ncbi:MAG: outer membrane protein transport protein [Acetobacteraceae bacterium]